MFLLFLHQLDLVKEVGLLLDSGLLDSPHQLGDCDGRHPVGADGVLQRLPQARLCTLEKMIPKQSVILGVSAGRISPPLILEETKVLLAAACSQDRSDQLLESVTTTP